MRAGRIEEMLDQWMPFERALDDAALNASSAPVNQPDLAQSCLMRGIDVFLDHCCDFSRRKRVQIEGTLDWDVNGPTVRRKAAHSSRSRP